MNEPYVALSFMTISTKPASTSSEVTCLDHTCLDEHNDDYENTAWFCSRGCLRIKYEGVLRIQIIE